MKTGHQFNHNTHFTLSHFQIKCKQYWPKEENKMKSFGVVSVTKLSEEQMPHFITRQLRLTCVGLIFISNKSNCEVLLELAFKYANLLFQEGRSRDITQIQYTSWPDHGVPVSPAALLEFRFRAKQFYNLDVGPTVVHCRFHIAPLIFLFWFFWSSHAL